MAPKKEGGRTRREAGAGQGERRKAGRAAEKDAVQGRGAAVVDFDLWGAFFGELWGEGAGGGSADERTAGKGPRAPRPAISSRGRAG
jgi:hypothetical protein